MTDNLDRSVMQNRSIIKINQQKRHYSQTQKDTKKDRMSKLKREIEYLERGMHEIQMTLIKLQQNPT